MPSSHCQSYTSATHKYSMLFGGVGCVALVLFLFSCSSIPLTQRGTLLEKENASPPRYSMVFIIHGDGDYLYHDTGGKAHRADEEALVGATMVAVQNPQAEVFIFHQKPRRYTLAIFPHRDGNLYYYRYGRLLAKESYRRTMGPSRFDPEVELYGRFHAKERPKSANFFVYLGHEIPEINGVGYDASCPQETFTVHDLADGLKQFASDFKFDLIVLSTCFNGTPHTVAALAPYARTIVASPDNLHLSYLTLSPFERLDVGIQNGDVAAFANNFAHRAFDRLTEDVQTAVTVAVYDVERVQGYLNSINSAYDRALTTLKEQPPASFEHCDCAEDSSYALPGMSEGVEVFYRPPHFGRLKNKQSHSGWECWRQSN